MLRRKELGHRGMTTRLRNQEGKQCSKRSQFPMCIARASGSRHDAADTHSTASSHNNTNITAPHNRLFFSIPSTENTTQTQTKHCATSTEETAPTVRVETHFGEGQSEVTTEAGEGKGPLRNKSAPCRGWHTPKSDGPQMREFQQSASLTPQFCSLGPEA